MSKLFSEAGFLSDEGKRVFKEVLNGKISMLLKQATNETELRIIGSLIQHRVGEMTTSAIVDRKDKMAILQKMSDEEFKVYLEEKYGKEYALKSTLTTEELERCPTISQDHIRELLEEGALVRQHPSRSGIIRSNRGPTYK